MADASYIIDLILRARDDTAAAFASAEGNQDRFNEVLRESESQAEKSRQAFEREAESIKKSRAEVVAARKAEGAETDKILEKQVAVEQAAKRVAQTNASTTASARERALAAQQLTTAEKSLFEEMKKREVVDGKLSQSDAARLSSSTREISANRLKVEQLREQGRVLKDLEASTKKYVESQDSTKAAEFKREINEQAAALRRLGVDQKDLDDLTGGIGAGREEVQLARQRQRALKDNAAATDTITKATKDYTREIDKAATVQAKLDQAREKGPSAAGSIPELERELALRKEAARLAGEKLKATVREDVVVGVDLDTDEAITQAVIFEAVKAELGRKVEIKVDVDVAGAVASAAAIKGVGAAGEGASEGFKAASGSVSGLSGALRGFMTLGIAVFLNQIVVGAIAAGGALVALAGSALYAGGALAGALAAGAAQAIPVVGVLGLAATRFAKIIEAVKQKSLVDVQQEGQAGKIAKRVADATDRIRTAQDALTGAQGRQTEAQNGINQARIEAARALQDLILQEREAELAARGATLSQVEAQDELNKALQEGDYNRVQRARLAVDEAPVAIARAKQNLGKTREDIAKRESGQSPEVEAAEKQAEAADKALKAATIGLAQARRAAKEAAAENIAAAGKLEALLAKMSENERRLYDLLTKKGGLIDGFTTAAKVIADPIIGAVVNMLTKIGELLDNSSVIGKFVLLSQAIADSITEIFDAFTNSEAGAALGGFIDEAIKNLPLVTAILINLGEAFLGVGTSGSGVLTKFLEYLVDLTTKLNEFVNSAEGSTALKDFFAEGFKQVKAFMGLLGETASLFLAIVDPKIGGGAKTGRDLITGLAKAVGDLNDAARSPEGRAKLQQFFENTRKTLVAMKPIVIAVGHAIDNIFSPAGVAFFTAGVHIISDVLLPVLVDLLQIMGLVTGALGVLTQVPFVGTLLRWATVIAIVGSAIRRLRGLVLAARAAIILFANTRLGGLILTRVILLTRAFSRLSVVVAISGTVMRVASTGFWALNAALAANPVGVIVIAVLAFVAALVLAYKKSETFREIVGGVFTGLKDLVKDFADAWIGAISQILGGISSLASVLAKLPKRLGGGLAEGIEDGINTARDNMDKFRESLRKDEGSDTDAAKKAGPKEVIVRKTKEQKAIELEIATVRKQMASTDREIDQGARRADKSSAFDFKKTGRQAAVGVGDVDVSGTTAVAAKAKAVVNKVVLSLNELTKDGGVLSAMATAVEKFIASANVKTRLRQFKMLSGGRIATEGASGTITEAEALGQNIKTQERALVDYNKQIKTINNALRVAENELKRAKTETEKEDLRSQITMLKVSLQSVNEKFTEAMADIVAKRTEKLTKETDKALEDAKGGGLSGAQIEAGQKVAEALGLTSLEDKYAGAAIERLRAQATAYRVAIDKAKRQGLKAEQKKYEDLLLQANADISTAIAKRLEDSIAVVLNVAQQRAEATARIDTAGGLLKRISGVSGGVAAAQLGARSAAQTGVDLQRNRGDLIDLLQRARQERNAGAQEKLTIELIKNSDAIVENTVAQTEAANAVVQAGIDAILATRDFKTGLFSGLTGLVDAVAANAGPQDLELQKSFLAESGAALRTGLSGLQDKLAGFGVDVRGQTGVGLAKSLRDAQTGGQIGAIQASLSGVALETFNNLLSGVVDNATKLEENTTAINLMNSSITQTFQSSAWKNLRQALFTGSGGIMPTYSIPTFDTGGEVIRAGLAKVHPGDIAVKGTKSGQTATGGWNGNVNIAVNESGGVPDPRYLASLFAFEMRTLGNRR